MRARSGKTVLRKRARTRKLTKGFRLSRHNLYRQSIVTLIRGRKYAFRDRRVPQAAISPALDHPHQRGLPVPRHCAIARSSPGSSTPK